LGWIVWVIACLVNILIATENVGIVKKVDKDFAPYGHAILKSMD